MRARGAILLFVMIAAASAALACAPAPRDGEHVDIVEESAVIVWDPSTGTENFIRRATFQGKARDFGFLVPTPTAPALAEAGDEIFRTLEEKTARRTVHQTVKKIDWTPALLLFFAMRHKGDVATARAPVEVLATQKLSGYEAAVLDATDATALGDWLTKNGYATTPDLTEWLDAYVKQGWKITAFKIDKSQPDVAARTSPVRMTFHTERPFFPYREPASQRANTSYDAVRSLRIFFLGPERVAGRIGENTFWPGVMTWSDRAGSVPDVNIPPRTRLTAFTDTSRTRSGFDDLFFTRAAVQSAYVPPPWVDETVVKTHVPLDVLAMALIAVVFGVRRLRRRASRGAAGS